MGQAILSPFFRLSAFREYEISIEYKNLQNGYQCPNGIYLMPSLDRPNNKFEGFIIPKEGPYLGALIRFDLMLSSDYPEKDPTIVIHTEMFHPLVKKDGTCLYKLACTDCTNVHNIVQVLTHLHKCFSSNFLSRLDVVKCPNEAAAIMVKQTPEKFNQFVRKYVEASLNEYRLYDEQGAIEDPPASIIFSRLSPEDSQLLLQTLSQEQGSPLAADFTNAITV